MDPTALGSTSRFPAPNRTHPRSPSRSPSRRLQSHELDPLLSNLSPTSTLEALETIEAVQNRGTAYSSVLRESVAAATTSERALGIRAALAAKKTREWCNELRAWPWPTTEGVHNGFALPSGQEASRIMGRHAYSARLDERPPGAGRSGAHDDAKEKAYYGSLPANVVQEYEDRIDTISDDMETFELDELKDYVRDAHLTTGSRRSSLQLPERNSGHASTYNRLDDFTAVITATIMQALPTITQLYLLLDTWSVRLTVLRRVPEFLTCLQESQVAIASAWNAVGKSEVSGENLESAVSREAFTTMRSVLETKISELGRRLDRMLDMLEGREDVLPEKWIDSMDNLEVEFGTWVVETENQVLKNELIDRESKESIEAINETSHKKKAEIQDPPRDPRTLNGQWDSESIEWRPTEEIGDEPDAKSGNHYSARSTEPVAQGHQLAEWPDLEANESNSTTQGTVNMINGSYSVSVRRKLPSEVSPVGLRNAEANIIRTENVYNLPSARLECESPDQEILSHTVHTSRSSGTPEHSSVRTRGAGSSDRDFHGVELRRSPTVNPQKLITAKSLPVKTEMEILDTLEAELLEQKHGPAARPGPLVFHKTHSRSLSNVSSDMSPDTSYPGSATSEYFSNMSSPEIRDASRAEYFACPIEVTTPSFSSKDPMSPNGTVSRQSSQRTERGDNETNESIFPSSCVSSTTQRSRASTFKKELGVNDIAGFKDGFFPSPSQLESESKARSASVEAAPKSVIGDDSINRSESCTSTSHGLGLSQKDYLGLGQPLTSALLRLQDEESAITATAKPTRPFVLNSSPKSALGCQSQRNVKVSTNQHSLECPPPIPPKSRHRFEDVTDLGPGSTPIKVRQRNRANPANANIATPKSVSQSSNRSPVKNSDDQLEARISSILTDIPAHIRLTSGPEVDAPEVLPPEGSQDPQTPATGSPAIRLLRSQSSVPSPPMTLVPAHPKSSKARVQYGDPEIKLYHLHQSGKAAPIKLYIRLVGENGERVMVRIGGGWADLGEYLKEYAAHHGRRSVSDGRFDFQGLPRSQSSSPMTALTGHPTSHDTPRSTPASPSMRDRRLSELTPSESTSPTTPENPAYTHQNSTSRSRDSSPASMRPSSRQSWTEDDSPLGLAGPKTRKVDISPRKQAWVDGMVDQARNSSAEKKKGAEGDFGDLGKVGGTKRLFMKSKKEG